MRLSTSLRLNAQKGTVTPVPVDPTLTLDLRFADRQSYVADIGPLPTFTRASTGTYIGNNGLIQSAAINTARIDFDPTTLACRGLLIEEQRVNLSTWSEDLTNAAWVKSSATVSANQTTAPDGASTADLVSEVAASAQHYVYNNAASVTSGTTYTKSVFVKKGTGATAPSWISIGFLSSGFGTARAAFNLDTGSFGLSTGITASSITQFPNGWWRVSVSAAATATGTLGSGVITFTNNTNTTSIPIYTGSTTSDIFVWGAQFEAGAFATSYIPTTTAAVTRSADVCSITGAAFTGFYNAVEGVLVLKMQKGYQVPASTSQLTYLSINDGTGTNYIVFAQRGTAPSGEVFRVEAGGASQALLQASTSTVAALTQFGIAGSYKLNDIRTCINGGAVSSDLVATIPTVNQLQFITVTTASWISSIQYYNAIKTDPQLQALSTP